MIGIDDGPAGGAREGADRRVARAAARDAGADAGPEPLALLVDRRPRQGRAAAARPGAAPPPATGSPRRAGTRTLAARGAGFDVDPGREARRRAGRWRSARSAILELIADGEVRLVVNTPTPRSGAVRDAAEIRLAATAEGILCLTAIETAVAAAEALDPAIAARHLGGPVARRVGAGARRRRGRRRRSRPSPSEPAPPRDRTAFDLVIFDCDGVLVDSERLSIRLDVELLATLGWPMAEDEIVERWVGRTEAAMRAEIEEHLGRDVGAEWDGVRRALRRARSPRSSSRSTASPRRSTRSRRPAYATCVASSGDHGEDPAEPREDRPAGPVRRPDLQRRRRRARQAGAGPVPPRRGGDGRRAGPDGGRRGQPSTASWPRGAAGMWVFAYAGGVTPAARPRGSGGRRVFDDMRRPARRSLGSRARDDQQPERRRDERRRGAGAAAGASTTSAWPSDQSVSVVRATMITASGTSPPPMPMPPRAAPDSCAATHVAGPRAEHVAADDRRELDRPDEPGRQERLTSARRTPSRSRRCPSPAGADRRGRR